MRVLLPQDDDIEGYALRGTEIAKFGREEGIPEATQIASIDDDVSDLVQLSSPVQ